jgi:hypothetical protein
MIARPILALFLAIGLITTAHSADPPGVVTKPKARPVPAAHPTVVEPPPAKVMDRLDLESTQVTGNRELPKVMVIVPWKHAESGVTAGRPANSLMDEVLKPLDRDVMRRELEYYGKVGTATSTPASKPEN